MNINIIYPDPVKTGEAMKKILQSLKKEINEKEVEKVELQNKRRYNEKEYRYISYSSRSQNNRTSIKNNGKKMCGNVRRKRGEG